jgi:hypothetical protein
MKLLLEDFNAKVGKEDIFKPTIWNESLYQEGNDNGVRIVKLATSKQSVVTNTLFPHLKTISIFGPLLMGRLTTKLIKY